MTDKSRRQPRLTINKSFDSFDQFVQEYVTNISRSGVFIQTDEPLPVGSLVDLKFTVVMDGVQIIAGEGEVVRLGETPRGMGVAFRKLDAASEKVIDTLLIQR